MDWLQATDKMKGFIIKIQSVERSAVFCTVLPTMVEIKELPEQCSNNRKKIRQAISVPFLWEEKPGTPKKDWKPPIAQTVNPPVAPPPVKLVASVPFKWEEKPGKPLPCFFRQPSDSEVEIQLSPENLIALALPPPATATVYCQDGGGGDDDRHIDCGDDNGSEAEQFKFFESDIEAWGFETDESFGSAPTLTLAVSNVIPMLQTPSSPASETDSSSSTSSYATGTTSLVGAAFLECMFPLLSPDSSFLGKLGCSEKFNSYVTTPMKVQSKDLEWESSCSVAIRRPATLGELIMMSRRRSYRRKAVQMRRHNLSMEYMRKTTVGCGIFGINNWIEVLQRKWKSQIQLKLM
ncbi:unnamed protein product [Camellia sinensis]